MCRARRTALLLKTSWYIQGTLKKTRSDYFTTVDTKPYKYALTEGN